MDRKDFRKLARLRFREAKNLLENGHYEGAYYLCGYAVECALKACIAKQTRKHEFPDKNKVSSSHTHNLGVLVKLAGLESERNTKADADESFNANWSLVDSWNESSRYGFPAEKEARDLCKAAGNSKNGVLKWISQHW